MITGICIQNFKGVGDRIELELAPITLLFGDNSAGKSTISDVLTYLNEILTTRSAVPEAQSSSVKSDFGHLVHGHDQKREITVGITCAISDDDRGYFMLQGHREQGDDDTWSAPSILEPHFHSEPYSVHLELTVAHRLAQINGGLVKSAQVSNVLVKFNDELVATISPRTSTGAGLKTFLWRVNLGHELLPNEYSNQTVIEFISRHRSIFPLEWDPPLSEGFYRAEGDGQTQPSAEVVNLLNSLVSAAFGICQNRLRKRRLIGALRFVPGKDYQPLPCAESSRWLDGRAAWDLLAYSGEDALIDINASLVEVGAGYIAVPQYLVDFRELHSLSGLDDEVERMKAVMDLRLNSHRQVRITPAENIEQAAHLHVAPQDAKPLLWPADVGSGVAQLVPIVVACRDVDASFICVLQPELHVHPRNQAKMGDLFIDSAERYGHRFLLETHSEYLLLRLMRRIRETATNQECDGPRLTCADVAIHYVFKQDGQTRVKRLELDENGNLVSEWPDSLLEVGFWEKFGE